jgi:hypothetical protein
LEYKYEKKLQEMKAKYEELNNQKEDVQFRAEEEAKRMQAKYERKIKEIEESYQEKLRVFSPPCGMI